MHSEKGNAQTPEQLELEKRIELGKQRKLWRLEVLYRQGNITGRIEMRDRTGSEIMQVRENMYLRGLTVWIDPGHFQVIHPQDILEVHCWKQDGYFGDVYIKPRGT